MKFAHIISRLYSEIWNIRPEVHVSLGRALHDRLKVGPASGLSRLDDHGEDDGDDESPACGLVVGEGIAVIRVHGIIGKHLSMMESLCGGVDLANVDRLISTVADDPAIHTVIFDINSPGGVSIGVPETAAAIRDLGRSKQTIAYTDYQMCSAGYWLGSQCREVIAAPSAIVGSIGGYIALIDSSRAWEMEGYKLELFRVGELKAAGMDGKPITDDERTYFQGRVDRNVAEFKAAVTAARGAVEDSVMQGQVFDGRQSLGNNLVDDLANSLQDVVTAAMAAHAVDSAPMPFR